MLSVVETKEMKDYLKENNTQIRHINTKRNKIFLPADAEINFKNI